MLNKFLLSTVLSVGLSCLAVPMAQAQDCNVNYEMVTKLFHPDPGSYAVWETNYGEADRVEEFTSITLPMDSDQGVVAVGEMRQKEGATPDLMLVRVDHRGRPVWEKFLRVDGLDHVVKILPRPEGYIVASNAKGGVWLGFFNPEGVLLEKKVIADSGYELAVTDIVADLEDKGWVLAITETQTTGTGKSRAVRKASSVYKIDTKGNVILKRAFTMGGDNEILGLSKSKFPEGKFGYIATGYLENNIGKKIALAMRLEGDGSIVWQQEYGRGLNAQLNLSSGYRDRYVLAFGDVRPSDAGAVGSWLMLLDSADGNTLWQRYYNGETGAHDYRARGLYVNQDSLITLLMGAKVSENPPPVKEIEESDKDGEESESDIVGDIKIPDLTDYAHVLTLSPRGVTLAGDSYFQGTGVSVGQLIEGPRGERMIAGGTMAKASAVAVPRDFKPDWDKDFAYGPDLQKPLPGEMPKVNLPDAPMSENAKSGLALLNKKLQAQRVGEEGRGGDVGNQIKSDNLPKNVQDISESRSGVKGQAFSKNSWIVVGESPDPYDDPCKVPVIDLPKR